jgi:Zn-dependent protease
LSLRLRLNTIELAFQWRWAPILVLGTVLLGHSVMPLRFPSWAPETRWLTSLAVVLAGEAALLLHELSHALAARRSARIVFHGFVAETVLANTADHDEAHVALAGPAMNLGLAALAASARVALGSEGALDTFLLVAFVSNIAMAAMSLVPVGGSDGARVLRALALAKS